MDLHTVYDVYIPDTKKSSIFCGMAPRGLEPRTLRLLAVRSDQLSYETSWQCPVCTGLLQEP